MDDDRLLSILLTPEDGDLYTRLLGEEHGTEKTSWTPETQKQAAEGMVELFNTELDLASSLPPGTELSLRNVRNAMNAIYTKPENETWKNYLDSRLRNLHYQSLAYSEDANGHLEAGGMMFNGGDFLHFGVNVKYPESPDTLPSQSRIYVNTKPWAIGHIAAEIIKRAREKGYEPYGKVWDESSSPKPLHDRQDRILFYPTTKTHQDIILETLKEVHEKEPDSFETQPPILVEKTDIPGVGIADDPAKDEAGERQSFTQSRATILQEAMKLTLDKIYGSSNETAVSKGRIIDKRIVTLRDELQNGTKTKERALATLRQTIVEVSLKNGVSPDNFARNNKPTPASPERQQEAPATPRPTTPSTSAPTSPTGETVTPTTLVETINAKLTTETGNTSQTELPPQVFAKYLEKVPLPEGAKIGGLNIAIDGDKIKATGEVQKAGTSKFTAEFTVDPDGKLVITNKDVKFAFLIKRESDKKKLTDGLDNVASTLTNYLNTQINPSWRVGGYAIQGDKIGIKFIKTP